ncbi:membrane protein [Photobacterium aquae]|uniref:Membrane protein n=1 Tax=Photobacterium aquae TaxID=1195763 RepID=A0A0J1GWD0_9GAMM|nr:efflux transporter outer membrane subunit [Photobacterium aquae]KLV03704.1 membrane protein [Photobacterium aquae]
MTTPNIPATGRLNLAIALTLAISGCAVGPEYQTPTMTMADTYLYASPDKNDASVQAVPKGGHLTGAVLTKSATVNKATLPAHWWNHYQDPTLNRLITDMQNQNLTLQIAAQRIQIADNYKQAVESFKVPSVNIGGGYVNYQLSKNDSLLGPALNPLGDLSPGLPPQIGNTTLLDNQHDGVFLGAGIAWELDLFGRIDRQSNAATIRRDQAEIYRTGLTTLLTADLIHNYIQYRGAQARKQLAEENIADQRKTLALVEKVVASGYGSDLDLAQANAMLAASQSILPQLDIAAQVHKHRLALLLGESLSDIEQRLEDKQPLPELNSAIPVGLPSDLLTRRPDIQIAEREMAAINEEWAASVANRYPKFFLTGAPGISAGSFDDLFSSDSFGWVGSAGVSWNLFDGGRGKALEAINEARFKGAALGYEQTVNAAIAEVDTTLFTYGRSQANQHQLDAALKSSTQALAKAKSLYQAGLIDHLAVLDAQRQQRMMEDRQIAAKLQTAQATVAVYKALGGDWQI